MEESRDNDQIKLIPEIPDCQKECLYDFIFNKAEFGVFIIDIRDNKLVFKNQYFKTIARGQENQIIQNIYKLIKQDKLLTGEQRDIIINVDSLSYDIGISGYQISQDCFLIFLKDISSKKISQERRNMNKFYYNFSKALGAISHEVGNPLSSIGTTLQIILSNIDKWDSTKQKDYLTKTINEIKRIGDFLKKVRNFSWDENLDIKPASLKDVVTKVVERNELLLKSKNITIEQNLESDFTVYIDKNALYQVLFNLLNNSISALKDIDNAKVSILVEEYNENFVKLIYKNNGAPISENDLQSIFTLFFTTNEKGRGLGLAICLKLMTLMGGTIKAVLPEDGIGAEFNLFIPLNENKNNISDIPG
jgi:signal transduction histidine kinase